MVVPFIQRTLLPTSLSAQYLFELVLEYSMLQFVTAFTIPSVVKKFVSVVDQNEASSPK